MTMTKSDPEREERRRQQAEIADSLKASGALDEIFARIDAGEPLTGHAGLLKGMLKATLEAPGVLGDELGVEGARPVPRDVQVNGADIGQHRLGAGAVAVGARPPSRRVARFVAEMVAE